MPLAYGGGVRDLETAKKILSIGFEKIVINTSAIMNPNLISEIAHYSGNQSVIVSIDVKKTFLGSYQVYSHDGTISSKYNPVDWAKQVEELGAGEILLTAIDREGTWSGFDIEITKKVSNSVNIPVIAHGGGGSIEDIGLVVNKGKASAVALGSMVVYQKKGMGVLVNFPDKKKLNEILK
jgi:cyclase